VVGSGPKIRVEIDASGYTKNEINLAVATCCAELETAAWRCLMHCTAAQLRGNVALDRSAALTERNAVVLVSSKSG